MMITISEPIDVENKTFENQEIRATTDITEGGLTFRNCKVESLDCSISNCSFENCHVDCSGLFNCTLTNCDITTWDGGIKNCKIANPKTVFCYKGSVTDCSFADIFCDNDAVIFPENCDITNCTFENIELRNGAYLVEGTGISGVMDCRFVNCKTERMDRALFYGEDIKGILVKKRKAFDLDCGSNIGLDAVEVI